MTDLQAHVEAPGRADLVKQVSEKIKEIGVDYIYYQFISVTGRIVGKGIPSAHWERLRKRAFSWSMVPPPTCLSIVMVTISATGPNPGNWSVSPTPRLSASCPGTSVSDGSSVPCSVTAKSLIIRVVY